MFSEPLLKQVAKSQEHAAIVSVWLLMDAKWVVELVLIQKLTRRALFRLMIHIGGINRLLADGERVRQDVETCTTPNQTFILAQGGCELPRSLS